MSTNEEETKRNGFTLDGSTELSLTDIQLRALGMGGMEFGGGEASTPKSDFSLRTPLYVVFRHKWKILACFLMISAVVIEYVKQQPDKYVSQARVVLTRSERRGVTLDPLSSGSSLYQPSNYGGTGQTELGILSSTRIAEEVVARLGKDFVLDIPAAPPAAEMQEASAASENNLLHGAPARLLREIMHLSGRTMTELKIRQEHVDLQSVAVYKVQQSMEVGIPANSDVMAINYTDVNPEHAQTILSAIVDVYVAEHIAVFKSQIPTDYFMSKATEWKEKFKAKEDELQKLGQELNFSSFDVEQTRLTTRLGQLHDQVSGLDASQQSIEAKLAKLRELMGSKTTVEGAPLPVAVDSSVAKIRDKLTDLQLQKAQLLATFTEASPQVQDVQSKIDETSGLLRGAAVKPSQDKASASRVIPAMPDPANLPMNAQYQQLLLEQQGDKSMRETLSQQLAETQSKLDKMRSAQQRVASLQMEKRVLEEQYLQYLKSNQISEIAQKLDDDQISNLHILQRPTLPGLSMKNQRKLLAVLFFGCLAGLALGIGLASFLEILDQSIKTADDVEKKLNLPHLASIPRSGRIAPRMKELAP